MRIAHRATSIADARRARDVLLGLGIPAYIADEESWNRVLSGTDMIRVMVDNRAQDRARRALEEWRKREQQVNS